MLPLSLSLFLNRRTCCIVIILATLLFLLCVLLNAYMTAFTANTLLRFVSLFLPSHRQPSMQSQFEFHIYKHEAAAALPLLFLLFALRDPNRVQFVDLFTFLRSIVDGFLATCRSAVSPLVRPHVQNWLWLLGYLLAGVGFDVAYAWLVRYSNAVFRWECEGGFTQLVRASGRVRGDAGDHVGVRGALRGEWGRLIFRTCPRTTR